MAKRTRGSSIRPGQRARLQRSATTRPTASEPTTVASPRPVTLTAEEEARAAALEAEILAEEKAATDAARRTRERSRRGPTEGVSTRTGSIAVRAADEYAYVVRDVRRIAVIGGSMVALLLGLWVVVETTGIGPI